MSCPPFEVLSAYADGQALLEESSLLEEHLPGCLRCASRLKGMRACKTAVATFAAPAMPQDLGRALLGLARQGESRRPARWAWLQPALGFALAAVLALLGGDGLRP